MMNLILKSDTLATVRSYEFEDFKKSLRIMIINYMKLRSLLRQNNVFEAVGDVIITSVVANDYFKTLKNTYE